MFLQPDHSPVSFARRLPVLVQVSYTSNHPSGDLEAKDEESGRYVARLTALGFKDVAVSHLLTGAGRRIGTVADYNHLHGRYDRRVVQELQLVVERLEFAAALGRLAGRAGEGLGSFLRELRDAHDYAAIRYEVGGEEFERELKRPAPSKHDLARRARHRRCRDIYAERG